MEKGLSTKGLSTKVKYDPLKGILTIFRQGLTPLFCRINGGGLTKIEEGENITITGTGTDDDPYIISANLAAPAPEKFSFNNNAGSLEVPYDSTRRNNYGSYPSFDLWINEGGSFRQEKSFTIEVDQEPPDQTQYTIRFSGPASGFLILKS